MELKRKVTESARGEHCWIRLPNICGNPETVVFAHYREIALGAGVGTKGKYHFGAPACSSCHDELDRRTTKKEREWVRCIHAQASLRYLYHLLCKQTLTIS